MSPAQSLTWENFRTTVFVRGQQRVHRISDTPLIEIFGDGMMNRIGIWLETSVGRPIPPEVSKLTFITSRVLEREGRTILEIATAHEPLQREFYHFALAVAEKIAVDERPADVAVTSELQCFSELLRETARLGIERQLGLLGELLLLERLIKPLGVAALDSWLGPTGEPHDFRLKIHEFEVKTTVSPRRIHTIHGLEQLVPSAGCSLQILSVMLGPAGAGEGFSLSGKIELLKQYFAQSQRCLERFLASLENAGIDDAQLDQYPRRFALRRPMAVVPVDRHFPVISRETVQSVLGALSHRIDSLDYVVNLEGLEFEDGTFEFTSLVPG